jgi:hypothetical protein
MTCAVEIQPADGALACLGDVEEVYSFLVGGEVRNLVRVVRGK